MSMFSVLDRIIDGCSTTYVVRRTKYVFDANESNKQYTLAQTIPTFRLTLD